MSNSVLRVGAADDADIVIKQPTVSRYHCELRWKQGSWELHDLNSTNGTYVDGQRISQPRRLTAECRVTLGRGIVLAIPEPPIRLQAESVKESQSPTPQSSVPQTTAKPYKPETTRPVFDDREMPALRANVKPKPDLTWFYVAVATSMLLMAMLITYRLVSDPNARPPIAENQALPEESKPETAAAPTPKVESPTPEPPAQEASPIPYDPAFWAVLVESADGKTRKLLGTAVAIDRNRLLTLASIVDAAEASKATFPKLVLMQPQKPDSRMEPVRVASNPQNRIALVKHQEFQQRLEEFEKQLAAKPGPDSLQEDQVLKDGLEWAGQYEAIMSEIARTDAAYMLTKDAMQNFHPLNPSAAAHMTECVIRGFPTFLSPPDITTDLSDYYLDLAAKCVIDSSLKDRLFSVEVAALAGDIPVLSMVCLNAKSELMGVCVREAASQDVRSPKKGLVTPMEVFW